MPVTLSLVFPMAFEERFEEILTKSQYLTLKTAGPTSSPVLLI